MTNRKTTYVTKDRKYQMVYTPQRAYPNGTTRLASFDLQKLADRGDLGVAYVTINGYATNYTPSRAFPLETKINEVMQMLVTDYNVAEWFEQQRRKVAS